MTTHTAFHLKYRPKNLDRIVGHENAVTQLKGIIASKKTPSALLFTGPSSAGKTTLARAFAASLNGLESIEGQMDYMEINAADTRTIDDMRTLIQTAALRPMSLKRRIILLDEAQSLLSLPASVAALLKPLEQPAKSTVWILSSMEPDKFASTQGGRALANRCVQFNLDYPTDQDLRKQAVRIIKGEKMSFMTKELMSLVVQNCNREMRTLANILEKLNMYYSGLDEKPETLKPKDIESVITNASSNDDKTAVRFLLSLYNKKLIPALKEVAHVTDVFRFINTCIIFNKNVLIDYVLKGDRHPKVWFNQHSRVLKEQVQSLKENKKDGEILGVMSQVQNELLTVKQQTTTVVDLELLISLAHRVCKS